MTFLAVSLDEENLWKTYHTDPSASLVELREDAKKVVPWKKSNRGHTEGASQGLCLVVLSF